MSLKAWAKRLFIGKRSGELAEGAAVIPTGVKGVSRCSTKCGDVTATTYTVDTKPTPAEAVEGVRQAKHKGKRGGYFTADGRRLSAFGVRLLRLRGMRSPLHWITVKNPVRAHEAVKLGHYLNLHLTRKVTA